MPAAAETARPSPDQPVPEEFDLLCESCGYSLVGLMSDRCPECGAAFDPTQLPLARVPWLYRRRLGKLSSYLQTCWRILWRPSAFAKEMCRPIRISVQDARLFRRLSIRIVMATAILLSAAGAGLNLPWTQVWAELVRAGMPGFVMVIAGIVFGIVFASLLLRLATDLPTFIWRGLDASPNDLAPLHYYAAAPLCLVPLVAIAGCALLQYATNLPAVYRENLQILATAELTIGGILIVGLLWWIPQRLMKQATGCGFGRVTLLALYLPVHWLLMALMCVMAFALAMFVTNWFATGSFP